MEACVTDSIHVGDISHRCMHSSCLEAFTSWVIYNPRFFVITVVFVLNTPLSLSGTLPSLDSSPVLPSPNPGASLSHRGVCCSHQDPGALVFYELYSSSVYLCQSLEAKTQKVVSEYPRGNIQREMFTWTIAFVQNHLLKNKRKQILRSTLPA